MKAKAEVLERLEDAKEMTEAEYQELVKAVAGTYSGVKSATKGDVKEFQKEIVGSPYSKPWTKKDYETYIDILKDEIKELKKPSK